MIFCSRIATLTSLFLDLVKILSFHLSCLPFYLAAGSTDAPVGYLSSSSITLICSFDRLRWTFATCRDLILYLLVFGQSNLYSLMTRHNLPKTRHFHGRIRTSLCCFVFLKIAHLVFGFIHKNALRAKLFHRIFLPINIF